MDIEQRKSLVTEKFSKVYNQSPTFWAQAPGRVDLMGSHTDYNEGFVLTEAIDRNTWIAARPRDDNSVRICSLNAPGCAEFELINNEYDEIIPWTNYVRGVADIMQQEGYLIQGFDIMINEFIFGGIVSILMGLISILLSFFGQIESMDFAFADFLYGTGTIIIVLGAIVIVFGLIF